MSPLYDCKKCNFNEIDSRFLWILGTKNTNINNNVQIVHGGKTMKTIEDHIQHDKELLADPNTSEPMKSHTIEELHELEVYADHHHDEIEAGDHHDPNALELFCEMHPDEPECLVYDD